MGCKHLVVHHHVYSLYGSFFDLSESGYYPPTDQSFNKSDNKLLTIDGRPIINC